MKQRYQCRRQQNIVVNAFYVLCRNAMSKDLNNRFESHHFTCCSILEVMHKYLQNRESKLNGNEKKKKKTTCDWKFM